MYPLFDRRTFDRWTEVASDLKIRSPEIHHVGEGQELSLIDEIESRTAIVKRDRRAIISEKPHAERAFACGDLCFARARIERESGLVRAKRGYDPLPDFRDVHASTLPRIRNRGTGNGEQRTENGSSSTYRQSAAYAVLRAASTPNAGRGVWPTSSWRSPPCSRVTNTRWMRDEMFAVRIRNAAPHAWS